MRYILLLMFIFIVRFSQAQNYHPFPVGNAQWSECSSSYTVFHGDDDNRIYGFKYVLTGDTFIQSIKYHLVGWQDTWSYYYYKANQSISPSISASNSPSNSLIQVLGAIREDSSKKIWFINFENYFPGYLGFPVDTEVLLYDFTMKVGDTLKGAYLPHFAIVVTSRDSILLNDSTYRKSLSLTYTSKDLPLTVTHQFWMEGIGSSNGLFGSYDFQNSVFDMYNGNYFNCFRQNGNYLYTNIGPDFLAGCDSIEPAFVTTGTNTPPSTGDIFIYPNPATNLLTVNVPQLFAKEIEIDDLTGRPIIIKNLNPEIKQIVMDISHLSSGLYFVSIKNISGSSTTIKIVKD